jgi:alpha-tubulin suppressor-like RCC1 family protein
MHEGELGFMFSIRPDDNKPTNKKIDINDVVSVATGYSVTAAIKKDGSLWTWGFNLSGALGTDIGINKPGIYKVDSQPHKIMDDVRSVSLGDHWGMAVKTDGTLWSWGMNTNGSLGNGTAAENSSIPVKIMEGVATAAAGQKHGLALKEDGTVWIWGSNEEGQLGNDDKTVEFLENPQKIMDDVSQISAGYNHSTLIKDDGTIWSWGNTKKGGSTKPNQVQTGNLGEVVQLVDGDNMMLLILNNGKMYSWSNVLGGYHEIMDSVVQASSYGTHILAIKEDGTIWAVGTNTCGQIGDGTIELRNDPVMIYQND